SNKTCGDTSCAPSFCVGVSGPVKTGRHAVTTHNKASRIKIYLRIFALFCWAYNYVRAFKECCKSQLKSCFHTRNNAMNSMAALPSGVAPLFYKCAVIACWPGGIKRRLGKLT